MQKPWITKALQSPLRRNKNFMNGFLKSLKISSKLFKRKQRKYTTSANYLYVLEILKTHGML